MAGEPYCYFAEYDADIQKALDRLRETEWKAGRYEPCFHEKLGKYLFELDFSPRSTFPAPGGCHESTEAAFKDGGADGTNSILDIFRAITTPFPRVENPMMADDVVERFLTAAPVSDQELQHLFGTTTPTSEQIEDVLLVTDADVSADVMERSNYFWSQVDRGQCRYVVAHRDHEPHQIFFAGFSLD